MPYGLVQFGNVLLPEAMPEDDLSTGVVDSALQDSIGGAFDYFGARQRLPRSQVYRQRGLYVGELTYLVDHVGNNMVDHAGNYMIAGTALQMLQGQIDAIKAMQGKQAQLWRQRLQDGILHWKTARLLQVEHTQEINDAGVVADVLCQFETLMAGWRSATLTTVTGTAIAGAPATLNAYNTGDFTILDAILRVQRTSGTITQVAILGSGIDITWTGSYTGTLIIDTGNQTVMTGSDQYSGFVLNAGHTQDTWLPLAEGHNFLTVTVTGGNANLSIQYYPQSA